MSEMREMRESWEFKTQVQGEDEQSDKEEIANVSCETDHSGENDTTATSSEELIKMFEQSVLDFTNDVKSHK